MGSIFLFAAGAALGATGTACCYQPRLLGTAADLTVGGVKLIARVCLGAGSRACQWFGLTGKKDPAEESVKSPS